MSTVIVVLTEETGETVQATLDLNRKLWECPGDPKNLLFDRSGTLNTIVPGTVGLMSKTTGTAVSRLFGITDGPLTKGKTGGAEIQQKSGGVVPAEWEITLVVF